MEFSYTIDDRIAGVAADLIEVDKKRVGQLNKLRFTAQHEGRQKTQFFNFDEGKKFHYQEEGEDVNANEPVNDANETLNAEETVNSEEPRWRKDKSKENKRIALENLETLSQALEDENKLETLEGKAETPSLNQKDQKQEVKEAQDPSVAVKEGYLHLKAIAYISLILYIMYITIGMGKVFVHN